MQLRNIFSPKTIQMQVINILTHCLTQKFKFIAKCKSNYLPIPLQNATTGSLCLCLYYSFRLSQIESTLNSKQSAVIFLHLVASVTLIIQMCLPGINGCLIVTTSHCFVDKK